MSHKNYQNGKKDEIDGFENSSHKKELFLFEPKTFAVIIIVSVITLLIGFFGDRGTKFLNSVLSPVPAHAPYDGVTYPIQKVPNYVKLTETERKVAYSSVPADKFISIPVYNPSHLTIPLANLKWNYAPDDAIRNEKITYSTPYLGSYRLDGLEGSGSHPAVDIKVPEGTPVHAIANGTVIKAEIGNGGFGNHIVLQHTNFPSLDDPNSKITLYSSYSHLSSIIVKTSDVVTKGQLIGYSGISGTATTPHLHFQIDTDTAAWHPYWPFTSAEQRAAGYSFFEAINNGLGQNNAITKTVNPLKYVQKYLDSQTLVASAAAVIAQPVLLTNAPDLYDALSFIVQVSGSSQVEEGTEIPLIVQAFDDKGNLISNPTFNDEIQLGLLNGLGQLTRTSLTGTHLRNGITDVIKVQATKPGKDKILLRFRNREFSSPEFEILPQKPSPIGFIMVTDRTELLPGETTNIRIRPLDTSGNILTSFVFTTLSAAPQITLTAPIGTISASTLTPEQFAAGEAIVSFTANTIGQGEVLISYKGNQFSSPSIHVISPTAPPEATETRPVSEITPAVVTSPTTEPVVTIPPTSTPPVTPNTSTNPFTDITSDSPYFTALTELKAAGLVAGYGDGSFKPKNSVSRAEAITFILRVLDEKAKEEIQKIFPDVPLFAWYSKFVTTAFELGFVKGYPDGYFRPDATVTLAEFATMLFVGSKTDIDPSITTLPPTGVDGLAWYAPYIQEAIKQNLITVVNNTLSPENQLTRGEIADIIWRYKKIAL